MFFGGLRRSWVQFGLRASQRHACPKLEILKALKSFFHAEVSLLKTCLIVGRKIRIVKQVGFEVRGNP